MSLKPRLVKSVPRFHKVKKREEILCLGNASDANDELVEIEENLHLVLLRLEDDEVERKPNESIWTTCHSTSRKGSLSQVRDQPRRSKTLSVLGDGAFCVSSSYRTCVEWLLGRRVKGIEGGYMLDNDATFLDAFGSITPRPIRVGDHIKRLLIKLSASIRHLMLELVHYRLEMAGSR